MASPYFSCKVLISILLATLPVASAGNASLPLIKSNLFIPLNGTAPDNYLKNWEMSYTATSYLPVCGLSTDSWGPVDWSNSNECKPAWLSFISAQSTIQSSFYDLSGAVIDRAKQVIYPKADAGEMKCLCFGIRHVKGRGVAFCLLVTSRGEILERKSDFNGNVAVGLSGPDANDRKILPTCEEFAVQNGTAKAAGSSSGNTSSDISSGSSTTPATTATENKKGLTTEAIIGIAIGLPGAIVAVITMITYIRKERRKRAERYSDVETGAAQKKSWAFWNAWKRRKAQTPVAATSIPMSARPTVENAHRV